MKTISTDNIDSLIELLSNPIENTNHDFILSSGISKHKNSIYKAIDSIILGGNSKLSSKELALKNTLSNFDNDFLNSLKLSLLTSYFTPELLVKDIINPFIKYIGKDNIDVLEPAAGSGNILKVISDTFSGAKVTAVEKDVFTSNILHHNFKSNSNINTINIPFEDFDSPKNYDFIISNVPFGNYGIFDKNIDSSLTPLYKNQIQNFFFLKSEQLLKPGGLIAFITTSSISDKKHSKPIREHLVNNLNFVSGFRLDNKTFKDSKTSVVADLLIFQKPKSKKNNLSPNDIQFLNTDPIIIDEVEYQINSYFNNNKNHILGDIVAIPQFHGQISLSVEPNQSNSLSSLLEKDLELFFDQSIFNKTIADVSVSDSKKDHQLINDQIKALYPNVSEGNLIVIDNKLYKTLKSSSNTSLLDKSKLDLTPDKTELLKALVDIRKTYKDMIVFRRNNDLDSFLSSQYILNQKYDSFDFFFGSFQNKRNKDLIHYDDEYHIIFSLEKNHPTAKNQFLKSDIFNITAFDNQKKVEINSIDEAIIYSLNIKGVIDVNLISQTLNTIPSDWLLNAVKDNKLFINPVFDNKRNLINYEIATKTKFLSGFVNSKIKAIVKPDLSLIKDFSFLINQSIIENHKNLLNEIKPDYLNIKDIDPGLGEAWISTNIYETFARETLKDNFCTIKYIKEFDHYDVKTKYSTYASDNFSVTIPGSKWQSYKSILSYALYQNIPNFKKTIVRNGNEIKVVDTKLITAVQLKINKLNLAFKEWLNHKNQIKTAQSLENYYNFNFNSYIKETFSAADLDFSVKDINPYNHQKNGAWQLIQNNGGILDLKVGFGKTLAFCMAISKRLELGITKKEFVVGLNANFVELYESFNSFFPDKRTLLVKPSDITPKNIDETFFKIANNNYDVVFTAHSALMKFPSSPDINKSIYEQNLNEAKAAFNDVDITPRQSRDISKKIENLKTKLSEIDLILQKKKTTNFITFEDFNFDHITIDESHYFKNLAFSTKHTRVSGLGSQKDVRKTANLLSYIRSIQSKYDSDKGVTFSTGTTLSNSLTELYTIYKYLTPNELKKQSIYCFDQWARIYTRKSSEFEETVSGEIKMKERFRYFVKVPELAKQYSKITYFADDTTVKIEKPALKNHLVSIETYPEQRDYFENIKEFGKTKNTDLLFNVDNSQNNKKASGLICTNHGRKSSLDMRLVSDQYKDHPLNKINVMIDKALIYYNKYNDDKGTQLIFCDMGTPTSKGFNLYAAIKDNLIAKGIPKDEITFIHSHDKNREALFNKMNNGTYRFLIGSTQKAGVGLNVQQKLVAMHHLDFPWRPTDVEQRNGRGDRQGNLLLPNFDNTMNVFYYAKKESIDSYVFNLLQIKSFFISQIKNANITTRSIDEGLISDDGGLSYAHYIAACSSNTLFTDKLKLEKKYHTLKNLSDAYDLNKRSSKLKLSNVSSGVEKREKRIDKLEEDLLLSKKIINKIPFSIKINAKEYTSFETVGICLKSLKDNCIKNQSVDTAILLDEGFKISFLFKNYDLPLDNNNYKILIETKNEFKIGYKSNILVKDDTKAGEYIINALNRLPDIIEEQKKNLNDEKLQLKQLNKIVKTPFEKQKELNNLEKEIDKINKKIANKNNNDNDNENKSKKGPSL